MPLEIWLDSGLNLQIFLIENLKLFSFQNVEKKI